MVTEQDFIDSAQTDHGVILVRTPVTVTTDNVTGAIELTEGSTNNITAVFMNPLITFEVLEQGENKDSPVNMYVKGSETINKEDKIVWNTLTFRVESVSDRYFGTNKIIRKITMYLI